MKVPLSAALLAAIALAVSACGSSHPASAPPPTVNSTRLILDGAVRCTVAVTTPVQVGNELGVSVSFHNISKHTVNVQPGYGGQWVIVTSPDGTTYDSRIPWENTLGPSPLPIPLRPGATATRQLQNLRVRWEGPLRVTPGCDISAAPPVRVAVTSPGLPASGTDAVDKVVAATGHMLDNCRPSKPGVAVVGRIDPPSGDTPPLRARCSISLRREPGFYVAQVLVVTPPGLRGAQIEEPYEGLSAPTAGNRNTEAIAWQFVVTRNGATSVNAAAQNTTAHADHTAPTWTWDGSAWQGPGGSPCGGSGGGGGGVNGPDVTFVSACGS